RSTPGVREDGCLFYPDERAWQALALQDDRGRDGSRAAAAGRGARAPCALAALGAVPGRAPVGDGPRGLLAGWRALALLHARPGPLAGLPLGRGRPARCLRQRRPPLPRPRALESARPDPEGAALRPERRRGESRRGRQGVLLLPRRDPDRLLPARPL